VSLACEHRGLRTPFVTNSEISTFQKLFIAERALMKISRASLSNKEKNTVKRILLILGAVVLFVNTLVIPTVANADTPGSTSCGGAACKP
jgi:hypothetical protein